MWKVIIIISLVLGAGIYSQSFGKNDEMVTKEIVVQPGGTLYQAVADNISANNNINKVVHDIEAQYGITDSGTIQPYTTFVVTVKK